jgi:hypothetical protein
MMAPVQQEVGYIDPRNGEFVPDAGGGYINPETGQFMLKR